jgi:transposase
LKQWHRAGVWYKLLSVLLAELEHEHRIDWRRVIIDSASVRAPHGGRKTGPNPTDRRKLGSKHHIIVDANGIPLAIALTGANRHDITQLLPLVDKIPAVKGKPGRPRHRPDKIQGDRAYDSEPHRKQLKKRDPTGFSKTKNGSWQWTWKKTMGSRKKPCLASSV